MAGVGTFTIEDGIGVVSIDSPPVNALGIAVRRALDEGFRRFSGDDAVAAIVLICGGRTFFAGADITEFGKPMAEPGLGDVFAMIEDGAKPVVAAIHGTALGGGYELALICHYRIAVPSAKVGLPEVNLGLLPGAGGTQRLPRIVGVEAAMEIMTGGAQVPAARALELGMIDALAAEGRLKDDAVAFARRIVDEGRPLLRVRDRQDKVAEARGHPEIYEAFRARHPRLFRGYKAPGNIVRAIEAAAELDFDAGMARERELFGELMASTEATAQRTYFFAERETARVPDIAADTPALAVKTVAVIGTGWEADALRALLGNAGLAVTEDDNEGAHDLAITASLDVDEVTATHPGRLIGLHLFAPDVRLVEVIRGAQTAPEVVLATVKLVRSLGKVPLVARSGGLVDRLIAARDRQAAAMDPEQVAGALHDYGFDGAEAPAAGADAVARLLYPVVNEGAKILEEGVAIRASDIDVAAILAHGWPVYTGGPMFWADTVGLPAVVAGLAATGEEPAALLRRMAEDGTSFTRR